MPGPGRELQVRLYRDALTTPWGFRLHGGKDVKAPLTVQKVAVGSPVFGELQRDDIILEIQNNDATHMTHKQAQDMIRNAGGSMLLRIRRSGRLDAPPAPSYDGSSQKGFMLGRVKSTLSGVLTDISPTGGYAGYNNNYSSDYSPTSSYASGDSSRPVKTWNLPKPAFKAHPSMAGNLMEPGWTPECLRHPQRRQQPQPVHQLQQPHHKQYPDPAHHPVPVPVRHEQTGPPAWYGSLRPSGNSHQSDERVAGIAPHHRSMSPDYGRQAPVATAAAWNPGTAAGAAGNNGVMNLQYNTPLGLYSKANAQEALTGQMSGLAVGDSSGVRTESDVYRLVHDNEKAAAGGRRGRPAAGDLHLHTPQRQDDATRQSPSMNVLESRFVGHSDGAGMSDF